MADDWVCWMNSVTPPAIMAMLAIAIAIAIRQSGAVHWFVDDMGFVPVPGMMFGGLTVAATLDLLRMGSLLCRRDIIQ